MLPKDLIDQAKTDVLTMQREKDKQLEEVDKKLKEQLAKLQAEIDEQKKKKESLVEEPVEEEIKSANHENSVDFST